MDREDEPQKKPSGTAQPEGLTDSESAYLRESGGIDITDPELAGAYERIVAETSTREAANYLTIQQLAERLGMATSGVRQWSTANGVTAHRLGAKLMYPAWQLVDGPDGKAAPLPHLTDVGWAIRGDLRDVTWIMTTGQPELTVDGEQLTPAQWLASGRDPEPVLGILGETILW